MSEVRFALCHAVRQLNQPVAEAARAFGVSRKTAYKWLRRFDPDPSVAAMIDRPKRPIVSPRQVSSDVDAAVLAIRDTYGWGPRKKIHAILRREAFEPLPCLRTVANVLRRCGRVTSAITPDVPIQRFERSSPNELWQIDHKGPIEVERQKLVPLSVLDDHSRYALAFKPTTDRTMATTFAFLWEIFGDVGMPDAILCDNAFGALGSAVGLSWFDAQLVRLGIRPLHGRPYHPQTQGKVEAWHGSVMRELVNHHARRDSLANFEADSERWRTVYNTIRPHEALGDEVPLSRWRPSERKRPTTMPPVEYEPGAILRKVFDPGLIVWKRARIRIGHGLIGEWVRVVEEDVEIKIYYATKQVRRLRPEQLTKDHVV